MNTIPLNDAIALCKEQLSWLKSLTSNNIVSVDFTPTTATESVKAPEAVAITPAAVADEMTTEPSVTAEPSNAVAFDFTENHTQESEQTADVPPAQTKHTPDPKWKEKGMTGSFKAYFQPTKDDEGATLFHHSPRWKKVKEYGTGHFEVIKGRGGSHFRGFFGGNELIYRAKALFWGKANLFHNGKPLPNYTGHPEHLLGRLDACCAEAELQSLIKELGGTTAVKADVKTVKKLLGQNPILWANGIQGEILFSRIGDRFIMVPQNPKIEGYELHFVPKGKLVIRTLTSVFSTTPDLEPSEIITALEELKMLKEFDELPMRMKLAN